MKWFKHFTNARMSQDLTKVRMRYGADGYAIYWYALECIAGDLGSTEGITFDLKHDAEVIGFDLRIDRLRVEEIMKYMVSIGLFECSDNTISCLKLAKYLDKRTTRNSDIHRIINSYSGTVSENRHEMSETVSDSPRLSSLEENRREEKRDRKPKSRKAKPFVPPSLEEVRQYVTEKDFVIDPNVFWSYFDESNWHDSTGKKVKNWKQKAIVWNNREKQNKQPAKTTQEGNLPDDYV